MRIPVAADQVGQPHVDPLPEPLVEGVIVAAVATAVHEGGLPAGQGLVHPRPAKVPVDGPQDGEWIGHQILVADLQTL